MKKKNVRHKKVSQSQEDSALFVTFAPIWKESVSVVQWIEYWIPVPTIGVRLPTGIHRRTCCHRQQVLFLVGVNRSNWQCLSDRCPTNKNVGVWTFLNYVLTKCQTKGSTMFFLAPKYDLMKFVAFSDDSQNTDCCCMGNFLSFLSVLLGRKATFVIHTIRVDLFLSPSDLLTAPFFQRVKLASFYFHFPKI